MMEEEHKENLAKQRGTQLEKLASSVNLPNVAPLKKTQLVDLLIDSKVIYKITSESGNAIMQWSEDFVFEFGHFYPPIGMVFKIKYGEVMNEDFVYDLFEKIKEKEILKQFTIDEIDNYGINELAIHFSLLNSKGENEESAGGSFYVIYDEDKEILSMYVSNFSVEMRLKDDPIWDRGRNQRERYFYKFFGDFVDYFYKYKKMVKYMIREMKKLKKRDVQDFFTNYIPKE
jgi:hypothetical protein